MCFPEPVPLPEPVPVADTDLTCLLSHLSPAGLHGHRPRSRTGPILSTSILSGSDTGSSRDRGRGRGRGSIPRSLRRVTPLLRKLLHSLAADAVGAVADRGSDEIPPGELALGEGLEEQILHPSTPGEDPPLDGPVG
jgi:hypothetical protein